MNIKNAQLVFNNGINVLYGRNGQGKSAIFEAIAFCLTDRKKADSWKDYIRSGEKEFFIHMELSHKGKDFVFDFTGKASQGSVQKKVICGDKTYFNSDANDFIAHEFDSQMIENIVFTLQHSDPITNLTPSERRTIFKKIFNTDFKEILDKLSSEIDEIKQQQKEIEYKINFLKNKKYSFAELKEVKEEEILELKDKYSKLSTLLQKKESIVNSEQKVQSLKNSLAQNKVELDKKLKNIEILQKDIAIIKREQEQDISKLPALEEEKSNLSLLIQQKSDDQSSFESSAIEKASKMKEELSVLEQEINTHKRDLLFLQKQVKMYEQGFCDSCGQPCDPKNTASIKQKITETTQLIEEKTIKGKSLSTELEKMKEAVLSRRSELESLKNEFKHLESKIEQLKQSIELRKNTLSSKEEALQETLFGVDKVKAIIASISSEIEQYTLSEEEIQSFKILAQEVKKIEESIKALESEKYRNIERIELNKKIALEKEKDEEEIKKLQEQCNSYTVMLDRKKFIYSIFELDFPNYVHTLSCKILKDYMNYLLANTMDGLEVDLYQDKKGIYFKYKTKESDFMNTKLASGFETAALNIAFKCSIAKAYNSGILILDEPDSNATDESSINMLKTILTALDEFEQIFLITHKEEAIEFLKGNKSTFYVVNNGEFHRYSIND